MMFFNIFAQNIDCGYTLEPPRRGGSNEYPQSMFWSKNKKNRCIPLHTPVLPYIKVGYRGVYIAQTSFRDGREADPKHNANTPTHFFRKYFGHDENIPVAAAADSKMCRLIKKPTICICENKGAYQLCRNCTADQRLCFRYSDIAIALLPKSEIPSF